MTLTGVEIADFRADLGDQEPPYAFTDREIQRLYVRSGNNFARTKLMAVDQLLMNAAKFYNYVSGHTRQEQENIFNNLLKMRELLKETLNKSNQVSVLNLAVVPPPLKDEPDIGSEIFNA